MTDPFAEFEARHVREWANVLIAEPELLTAAESIVADSAEKNPEVSKLFRTAFEIQNESPAKVEWVSKPYVAAGAILEVDGKVKLAGKTTWILHLCRAVLDGELFMGEPTSKTPIVYLTEQPPTSFRVALEKAGLLGRHDFHVLYFRDVRQLEWVATAGLAVDYCKTVGGRLLVIDTLSQFARIEGDSENNSGDALAAMTPLMEAAGRGVAVIVSRHDRKSGGLVGESGRGSSAYSGAVDIVISIRRPDGDTKKSLRTIHAVGRFDETPDELVVELTDHGYVSHGTASSVAECEAKEIMLAAAPTALEDAVPLAELIEGSSVKRATAQRVIKALCENGPLARLGRGKKGNPFLYYLPGGAPSVQQPGEEAGELKK